MGQDTRTDSLRTALQDAPLDTSRVRLLLTLGHRLAYSDYKEALAHYSEAMKLSRELDDLTGFAMVNCQLGELYGYLGVYSEAMDYSLTALTHFKVLKDTLGMARAHISTGLVHHDLKQFAQAKEQFSEAERLYGMKQTMRGLLAARHNFASTLAHEGDSVKARQYYLENLGQALQTKYYDVIAATYNNLGNLMTRTSEADSALYYLRHALEYKRKAGRKGPLANTFMNIAGVQIKRGHLEEGAIALDSAAALITDVGAFELQMNYHEQMAALEKARGNLAAALKHTEQHLALQDSLYNNDRVESAERLEAAYRTKEQESQIQLQNKETELLNKQVEVERADKARLWWIVAAFAAGLLLAGTLLALALIQARERKRTYEMMQRKNDEIERQQEEILAQNALLAAQNRRLEDLNREKDGLIGVVAHDLRAPLNRSAALAELIASTGPLTPEQLRFTDMIRKVNEDGAHLIQDLLEMNAYENDGFHIHRHPVDMVGLLERSVKGFEKAAERKHIALHVEIPPLPIQATTDEKLLGRVLDNLISNAIKFTGAGKRVWVGLKQQNGHVELSVRDEGQGISKDDQGKMFRKFQRLSARPTGGESSTGLGLSIVKTLVERLDGEIGLQSEVGKGTEFWVRLPR